MKAMVYQGERNIEIAEIAKPEPGPGEVLLKTAYVGVCFSDVHAYMANEWSYFSPGTILGHEGSGVIDAIGPGVTGDWKIGDRVAVHPHAGCGECVMCRGGFPHDCQGSHIWFPQMGADYFIAPEKQLYKLPDNVSLLAGAAVEPIGVGTRAVRHSGMNVGDNVVILGADDYNISVLQWVKAGGAGKVAVVDPVKARRDLAQKFGADIVLDTGVPKQNVGTTMTNKQEDRHQAKIDSHPYPEIREAMPFGADIVFLTIERYLPRSLDYLAEALKIVRVGGMIAIVRAYYGEEGTPNFIGKDAWLKEVTIRHFGLFYADEPWRGGRPRGDYALTIQAMADGILDADGTCTKTVDWSDLNSKEDFEKMYALLPDQEAKVFIKF